MDLRETEIKKERSAHMNSEKKTFIRHLIEILTKVLHEAFFYFKFLNF